MSEKTLRELTEELTIRDAQLRDSEELFRNTFCLNPMPMCITKADGTFIKVNKGFLEISGYKLEELIGKNIIELEFYDDIQVRNKVLESLKNNVCSRNNVVVFNVPNGKITALLSSKNVRYKNELVILSIVILIDEMIVNLNTGEQYFKRGLKQNRRVTDCD